MSYLIFIICLILLLSLATLGLCLTVKVENLENKLYEKHSLVRASRRSLANAEKQITERNRLIEYQSNKIKKLEEKINKYEKFITSNNYGNAELRLQALKKLVTDYQSNNQF